MRTMMRLILAVSLLAPSAGAVRAEEGTSAASEQSKEAMAALQKLGAPNDNHKALEPFTGTWTYTAAWWMSPEAEPQAMTGIATNTLVFGGRFLKQEIRGDAEGYPPFEGLGFTGYDNIRKEYTSVWFDNMATGIMTGAGQFDPAAKTLTTQSDYSCPITGEAHRKSREVWTVVDADHTTYVNYAFSPQGQEYKAMEIRYTRVQ